MQDFGPDDTTERGVRSLVMVSGFVALVLVPALVAAWIASRRGAPIGWAALLGALLSWVGVAVVSLFLTPRTPIQPTP